jgi:branched-chain amino acid transport system permease protein
MSNSVRISSLFALMAVLLVTVGVVQSPSLALAILNLCLISAVMALGINIQWGYAGLLNVGNHGICCAWRCRCRSGFKRAGCRNDSCRRVWHHRRNSCCGCNHLPDCLGVQDDERAPAKRSCHTHRRCGYFGARYFFDPAVEAIESTDSAATGYLGGLGLPIIFSWLAGGLLAGGAAWLIGKVSLGLRSDYLAIATLGISEIIIAMLKNEDWLTRGVKNVTGLPRPYPVPYEIEIQQSPALQSWAAYFDMSVVELSSIVVKLVIRACSQSFF